MMSLGVSISDAEGKSKPLACSQERYLLPCVDESQAEGNASAWLLPKLVRAELRDLLCKQPSLSRQSSRRPAV